MSEQRRNHLRLPIESITFIELLSPRIGQSDSGKMTTCNSLDISQDGLQVMLEEEITLGAILQIGIVLASDADTLYLVGEVRWCLPNKDKQGSWIAGFHLLHAEGSDFERWATLVSEMGV